jgi:hypothetical protein
LQEEDALLNGQMLTCMNALGASPKFDIDGMPVQFALFKIQFKTETPNIQNPKSKVDVL